MTNSDQTIRAIEAVAAEYRRSLSLPESARSTVVALENLARKVQELSGAEAERLKAEILNLVLPVDPLRLEWNVFRLFALGYSETRWTQWMASLIDDSNGAISAQPAWMALCQAIVRRIELRNPTPRDGMRLACAEDWRLAWGQKVKVIPEDTEYGLGRVDLWLDAGSLLAVIEIKLWEHWHDRSGEAPQADRYREILRRRLQGKPDRMGSLVLLTCHEDLQPDEDFPQDYIYVTWREVAQALRNQLRLACSLQPGVLPSVELYPLFLTLVSLEQDVLGLRSDLLHRADLSWRELGPMTELSNYLEEESAYAR
jgi:hypothetical protein